MDQSKLISVIVPVYKVEQFLRKCIDSILAQTYQNIEIILVDDGSPDRCGEICDEYEKLDLRIHVIHQDNKGVSAARNIGIDHAKGEFISFIDSDDYISETMLENLYCAAQKYQSDLTICDIIIVDIQGHIQQETKVLPKTCVWGQEEFWNYLFCGNYRLISPWSKLYRKEIWKKTRFPNGKIYEDMFILPEIISQCKNICVIPNRDYYYVQQCNSTMHAKFSPSHLQEIEAAVNNIRYFISSSKLKFAQKSLLNMMSLIAVKRFDAYHYNKKTKEQFKELERQAKQFYWSLWWRNCSPVFILRGGVFAIHPSFYIWLRNKAKHKQK